MTDSSKEPVTNDELARLHAAIDRGLTEASDLGTGITIGVKSTTGWVSLSVAWDWLIGQTAVPEQWTPGQRARLASLGWDEPTEAYETFNKGWKEGIGDSIDVAVATLVEVHGVRGLDEISIDVDEVEVVEGESDGN